MSRVVLDTGVFVAAYLTKNAESAPSRLQRAWRVGAFTLVMSPFTLRELVVKLLEKGVPVERVEDLVTAIGQVALNIPGAYEATRMDGIDSADNPFLAASFESSADYLVSTDRHLLNLKHFHCTQILTPTLFVRRLESWEQCH